MAEVTTLRGAVAEMVEDGDSVALEGFTHLIPTAAHGIIRQERRNLALIRMTPDLIYDQMIGMDCTEKIGFSWVGNPGVGSLHRFRNAVEHGWPQPPVIEEHSPAGRHGGDSQAELGYPGSGPSTVVTDLGVLRPNPETKELSLVALHPGAIVESAREGTGWGLRVAEKVTTTEPPTDEELEILRELHARTAAARARAA